MFLLKAGVRRRAMGASGVGEAYGARDWAADGIQVDLALSLVAAGTGVPVESMKARGRLNGAVSRARRLALYLAYVSFEWPMERVSLAFGLHRATAAAACHWAEDARDTPAIDDLLDQLEGCARQLVGRPRLELGA